MYMSLTAPPSRKRIQKILGYEQSTYPHLQNLPVPHPISSYCWAPTSGHLFGAILASSHCMEHLPSSFLLSQLSFFSHPLRACSDWIYVLSQTIGLLRWMFFTLAMDLQSLGSLFMSLAFLILFNWRCRELKLGPTVSNTHTHYNWAMDWLRLLGTTALLAYLRFLESHCGVVVDWSGL